MKKFKLSKRLELYQIFKAYLLPQKTSIKLAFLFKWLLLVSAITSPLIFKILIDDIMILNNMKLLKWVILGYVFIWIYESTILFGQTKINNQISNALILKLRVKLWKRALSEENVINDTAEIKNCIDQDVEVSSKFIDSQIISYIYYWILSIIYAIILCFINWKLSIFGLLMVPLSFWMTRWLGKGVKKSSEAFRALWSQYEKWLQKVILSWKEIKSLNINKKNEIEFVKYWGSLSRLYFVRQLFWYGNRSFITFKDFFITRMNLYFIGGLLIYYGDITIGGLVIFMKYYELLFLNINNINNADMDLSKDSPSLNRIMLSINKPQHKANKMTPSCENGLIEFRKLHFRYAQDTANILKDINLTIRPGEKITIVGRSGSGKSTLIKILNGVEKPSTGEVLFNSCPVENLQSTYMKRKIGTVMQEPYLFNMSIRENLMLGAPKASDTEIEKACQVSGIHEYIQSLPLGYETVMGVRGTLFSGGQRQRIAIARTLLMNPDIIIFDESTSQLDNKSESEIQKKMDEHYANKTIITITHRISSISKTSRVLILDDGIVVGDGIKEELEQTHHLFKKLSQPVGLNV
ncbi:ABC transporter ATP-binding protein [Paenibacillus camerounensis]|uniref:ABC transporter ATP-binding protein n=1 Tax=Paenibacillus camerounensis TaxID=1243663 RepID=UPI0005AB1A53|nr:ABC transporter ATP-binding protein [Paenibacillus camerounensis]